MTKSLFTTLSLLLTLILLTTGTVAAQQDPMPSWKQGPTKRAIIDFVSRVTSEGSADFVPAAERIATFDNDGTLWTEKPLYIHFMGVASYMKAQMKAAPSLAEREPYKAVATKDKDYFIELYENAAYESLVGQLLGVPFGGMTKAGYEQWGRNFLNGFRHPRFKRGIEGLIYQPMVELIDYLKANGFRVYIFTADESAFLRLVSEKLYGIPAEQVQGTSMHNEFITGKQGKPQLVRSYRMDYLNNWDGKPRLIEKVIGKKPLFAAGNSNGDQHMLQYAASSGGMAVLVHHTDGKREFSYDKHTDKVMPLAKKEGWTVIDMKQDWKRIFPASRSK